MIGTTSLTPIQSRNPKVSAETAAAIEHGMNVALEDRYQSADEFKEALQAIQRMHGLGKLEQASPAVPEAAAGLPAQPITPPPPFTAAEKTVNTPRPVPVLSAAPAEKAPFGWKWVIGLAVILVLLLLVAAALILPRLNRAQANLPSLSSTAAHTLPAVGSPQAPSQASTIMVDPAPTLAAQATQSPSTTAALPASLATAAPTQLVTPIGGGNGLIAFASRRAESMQVWTMQVDGGSVRQVTHVQDGACQPDWSPDGKRLVIISPCKDDAQEHPGSSLFLIDLDGGNLVSLANTPGGDYDPAWSPDGTRIAFTSLREGHPHIYIYTLADNQVKRISPAPVYDREPAWSPDSQKIVFTTTRQDHDQIWTMNADGSGAQEFSNLDGGLATNAAWSRDGKIIVFSEGSQLPGLVAKRIDDRINEFKVGDGIQPVQNAHFSPDGQWIVFVGAQDGKAGFFRMSSTGTNLARISDATYPDIQPSWGP
jgi:hypothetical protein